jgi:hypothetical protein
MSISRGMPQREGARVYCKSLLWEEFTFSLHAAGGSERGQRGSLGGATQATPRPPSGAGGRTAGPAGAVAAGRAAGSPRHCVRAPLVKRLSLGGGDAIGSVTDSVALLSLLPSSGQDGRCSSTCETRLAPRPQTSRMASEYAGAAEKSTFKGFSVMTGSATSRLPTGRAHASRLLSLPEATSRTGAQIPGIGVTCTRLPELPEHKDGVSAGQQRAGAPDVRPATAALLTHAGSNNRAQSRWTWRAAGEFHAEFKKEASALVKTLSDPGLLFSQHRPSPAEEAPVRAKIGMLRQLKALSQVSDTLRLLNTSVIDAIIKCTRTGLEQRSNSEGEELCIAGLELLRAIALVLPGQAGVKAVVLESTLSDSARVRKVAIHWLDACAAKGDTDALQAAVRCTSDPDWLVGAAACQALVTLAEKNDTEVLRALTAQLQSEDWAVKTSAQAAVARLADAHRGWDGLKATQLRLGGASFVSGRAAIFAMSSNHLVAEEDRRRERHAALQLWPTA